MDKLSTPRYGIDVATTRLDDLDRMAMQTVAAMATNGYMPRVLECGAGAGVLAGELTRLSARVTAVDIIDHDEKDVVPEVTRVVADMRDFVEATTVQFDIAIMQRVIHYIPNDDARALLTQLREHVHGQLFISVTGISTAVAQYYGAVAWPVSKRFEALAKEGQQLFSIEAPLCLYSEDEFMDLLTKSGWQIDRLWTSAFGNHKAVCSR